VWKPVDSFPIARLHIEEHFSCGDGTHGASSGGRRKADCPTQLAWRSVASGSQDPDPALPVTPSEVNMRSRDRAVQTPRTCLSKPLRHRRTRQPDSRRKPLPRRRLQRPLRPQRSHRRCTRPLRWPRSGTAMCGAATKISSQGRTRRTRKRPSHGTLARAAARPTRLATISCGALSPTGTSIRLIAVLSSSAVTRALHMKMAIRMFT
jgi:hypothetical protein